MKRAENAGMGKDALQDFSWLCGLGIAFFFVAVFEGYHSRKAAIIAGFDCLPERHLPGSVN